MANDSVLLSFRQEVPMREIEGTLRLARLACEGLYGPDRVELEASYEVDHALGRCRIGTTSEIGRSLASIFRGYVRREFGEAAFHVIQE
jgi:hypothetical protein